MDTNGVFMLDQDWMLGILGNYWGATGVGSVQIHFNDRVQIYGIVTSIDSNRDIFQRLAEGRVSRAHLDDPSFSLKHIFQQVAFSFNNKNIFIDFPDSAYDIDDICNLDTNDFSRIQITRDYKCFQTSNYFHIIV